MERSKTRRRSRKLKNCAWDQWQMVNINTPSPGGTKDLRNQRDVSLEEAGRPEVAAACRQHTVKTK